MKRIMSIAAGLAVAMLAVPAAQAADGPSFQETVEYLESYLHQPSYSGTVKLNVVRRQIIKKSQMFTTGPWEEQFDFNAMSPNYSVNGNTIRLNCKASGCISRTLRDQNPPLSTTADGINFFIHPNKMDSAKKAFDHIFNNLLEPDPFAN